MHLLAKQSLYLITLLLVSLPLAAQEVPLQPPSAGYVNFNLEPSPIGSDKRQEVSLYGCNTHITTTATIGDLRWDTDNQVLPDVPHGYQQKGDQIYYVSKYYMASPPVFLAPPSDAKKPVIIGLVVPDRFTFYGEKPVQIVHLDYNILKPVFLSYVNVDYDYEEGEYPSCASQGVDLVPLNIQCADFAWLNTEEAPLLREARGASGIAYIKNDSINSRIFLPHYEPGAGYLNCEITVLDDILPNHEVFFLTEDGPRKQLNLTEFYLKHPLNEEVRLVCKARETLPEGCVEPKP